MSDKKQFYDTNILLSLQEDDFIHGDDFVISSQSLIELENIKQSSTKSDDIKYKSRNASRLLNKYQDKYDIHVVTKSNYEVLTDFNLPINCDNLILSSAYLYNKNVYNVKVVTNDNNCKLIANVFRLESVYKDEDNNDTEGQYLGYKDIVLSDEELEYFYTHRNENVYNNYINEYLLIRNSSDEIKDRLKWTGTSYQPIKFKSFKSKSFGDVKPLDSVQMCAFESITNNEITMLYGKAGSGKTTLPLAYIMQGIESQKIRKCYIVHHYETLKKAKTLGFEAGNHETKLLTSGSLGNILSSKFVDYKYITSMLGDKLEIIPTANIRGVEFGSDDVVFVTEAQNIDVYTLKTIIQRCKSGCKQIYEGDILEQSDVSMSISGMKRMLDVFKGNESFGCVKLSNNYRNPISELADRM